MLRFAPSLLLMPLLCLIISCDDSEETPDTTAPNIIIESPAENQRVAHTLTVTVRAEDADQQLSMQAFLDGVLLKEQTGLELTADVDTKTLAEGEHTLKVTASDKEGNTSEKEVTFEVRNTLFKVAVSSNYVPEDTRIYFALSKNDGSMIAFGEVANSATMTVQTPTDFNPDSTFVFTSYFHLLHEGTFSSLVRTINVYAGMTAGEFNIAEFTPTLPTIGSHKVEVTDVPTENYFAGLHGTNAASVYGNFESTGMITRDLGLKSNTSDLYFTLIKEGSVPVYKYINTIQVGGSTNFSALGLPELTKATVTTTDATGTYECYVFNPEPNNRFEIFSGNGNFSDGKIPLYYPDAAYPQYVFRLGYQFGNNFYENQVNAATPPATFQKSDASVSNVNYENRKLKVTATGTFDIISISGGSYIFDNNGFTLDSYYAHFPNSAKKEVTIPQTPDQLSDVGFIAPADFAFSTVSLLDYTALTSDDYRTKIVFSADYLLRQHREFVSTIMQITPTNESGRMATTRRDAIPEKIQTILKNHQIQY